MHRHGHHHRRGHRALEAAGAAGLTAAIVVAGSGMMEGEGWRGGRGPGRGRGPFGPGGPRRGGRARRGDVRAAILALLGESPMHGYQIIQELETRSNGLWRPSPGSIYPTLQLFEDEGLVTASEVDGKRVFQLTDAGRERLAEAGPAGVSPWDAVARETPEELQSLREGIHALMAATHQVAHAGSPKQSQRTLEVLSEARRKIYAILAEDEQKSGDDA
jgi:DNA-binding PadR family transcriptional regulator